MDNRHDHVKHDGDAKPNERTPSAAELQRRIEDTRQSITQNVAEIKSTMNTQYNQAKDRATESLDWKLQMRRYPVAACIGALAVGYLAGRSLSHATDDDHDYDDGVLDHDYTTMHGSSLAPSGASRSSRSLVPPQVKQRMASRVEDVLGNLADQFLNELTRVGRDVVVPGIMGALSSKLQNVAGSMGASQSSMQSSGQDHVGGTGSFGSTGQNRGSSYQGRSI